MSTYGIRSGNIKAMKKHKAGSWLKQIGDATFLVARYCGVVYCHNLGYFKQAKNTERCNFGIMLHYNAVYCGLPPCSPSVSQLSSAPEYLITFVSHKDIYLVYRYSIQMPHHSSKFKG